ncbi:MAG: hypothetical protein ACI4OZ_09215 [Akkermansia sp.]
MNTNITLSLRIKAWTRRNADGSLSFPRCVAAHISEILTHAPSVLTPGEVQRFTPKP